MAGTTQGPVPSGTGQGLLLGQYVAKVGAKGRIAFPKKFRATLGDNVIITPGYENSLIVVSAKEWKSLLEGTEGKPFTDYPARQTQRFILGGASEVTLDSKGRFILPLYLRDYAKVASEVVFVGLSRYVEMWDRKRWEVYRQELEKNIGTIAERLSKEEEKDHG